MGDRDDRMDGPDVVAGWFDLYAFAIGRYAARRVGPSLARDVVAETFRVAYEEHGRFDPQRGEPRAWLYGIATNVIRRHRRTEERRLRTQARSSVLGSSESADPLLDVVERVDAQRRLDMVIDAVVRLDPDDRDLLILIAWEEMSSRDASDVLGIPSGTVRSRLNRIRVHLTQAVHEGELHG